MGALCGTSKQRSNTLEEGHDIWCHQLSGDRRSWRADVGDQVREGEIRLVPNRRDHWHGAAENRTGQTLVTERGQVFVGSATPSEHDHVDAPTVASPLGQAYQPVCHGLRGPW